MLAVLLLLGLQNIFSVEGQVTYKIGNGSASWKDALTMCTLATPTINFTDMTVDFDTTTTNIEEGVEVWLGYLIDYAVFQYVGCMTYDDIKEPRLYTYTDTGADPGICFSACGDRGYIGLMKTKCFCFDTMPTEDTSRTTCTQTCSKLNNEAACGGFDVLSLYKQADGISVNDLAPNPVPANDGNCVVYNKNNGALHPSKCTMSYDVDCQSCEDGLSSNVGRRTLSWLDMTTFCFSARLCPYTYGTILSSTGNSQMWTGMIKARKLYRDVQGSSQPEVVGYTRLENGTRKLRFELAAHGNVKSYICQEGIPISTQGLTTMSTDDPDSTIIPAAIAEKDSTNLLPFIIIIAIVILVIVIITVALIILNKRRKKRKEELLSISLNGSLFVEPSPQAKRSLTDDSHLHNIRMYDLVDTDEQKTIKEKYKKESKVGDEANNLKATISLDTAIVANDAPVNGPYNRRETTTFADGKGNQSHGFNKRTKCSDTGKIDDRYDACVNGEMPDHPTKADNDYAKINKKIRRDVELKQELDNGEMYDKLGDEKTTMPTIAETDYDHAQLDKKGPEVYDTTSKPMSVPTVDNMYDGLQRF